MQKPQSISLSEATKFLMSSKAVTGFERIGVGQVSPVAELFPEHGILGYLIRDADFGKLDIAAAHDFSNRLASEVGKGAVSATVLRGKDLIVGFYPAQTR